ncbi:hypothetical protein [Macrococcoides canis]|uniref:hypothetical protein n=1 Tax=Macrococcoides canis TaxID=1855823 RepID=UPI0020B82110|nr:hypothetical protein [Macrococcus canis]UTH00516.1 hypothetical protein KFV04_02305 [Macrococcus canis]
MNLRDIKENYNAVEDFLERKISLPFNYTLFLVVIIMCYFNVPFDSLFTNIPKEFNESVLKITHVVYNNFVIIIILLFICIILIALIFEYTPIYKFLPESTQTLNGKIESINQFIAIKRLIHLSKIIITDVWIYFFIFSLIIDGNEFKDIFIGWDNLKSIDIKYRDFTLLSLLVNKLLYTINLLILIYLLGRCIFILKIESDELLSNISQEELDKYYIILNKKNNVMIIKSKYSNIQKFYLVKYENINVNIDNHTYEVINKSTDLSELIYQFDYYSTYSAKY